MDSTTPRHLTVLTGASRGLGLALAHALLAPDHILLCLSRQPDDGLDRAASACGAHLEQWVQDLSAGAEAAERLQRWLHSLHAPGLASATLINNASVIPPIMSLHDCPPDAMGQALRVGLEAPMQLTAAFLRQTQAWVDHGWEGPRRVLNISSGLGRRPMASQAPYCAAKAGLDHFSRCVALEQAQLPHGVRIVSLAPGVIDTDMQVQLRSADPARFPDHGRFVDLQRQGLLTSPAEAAQQVLSYLARPDFGKHPVADVRD
jgi:NAD(P)-dependent dehydrogenase (short-subunit alcohol dehydrogenase family)